MPRPIRLASAATQSPTISETRAPWTVRENTSRPNWSVPNQNRSDGGRSRLIGACRNGSATNQGPMIAIATRTASSAAPTKMVGLRRIAVAALVSGDATSVAAAVAESVTGLIPDAGIEEHVGDIDNQVHQHLGGCKNDDEALYDRVVAFQDR